MGFTPGLPVYIYTDAVGIYNEWHRRVWATRLILLAVVALLNFVVRMKTGRSIVQASQADGLASPLPFEQVQELMQRLCRQFAKGVITK